MSRRTFLLVPLPHIAWHTIFFSVCVVGVSGHIPGAYALPWLCVHIAVEAAIVATQCICLMSDDRPVE